MATLIYITSRKCEKVDAWVGKVSERKLESTWNGLLYIHYIAIRRNVYNKKKMKKTKKNFKASGYFDSIILFDVGFFHRSINYIISKSIDFR